ncbi:N-acetylneuraminate lyase-like [Copidosoma floridanum]|uniref:N-acetylneuraminate lyase-like n=1 Tax=Copidosoma floridanum TaxID=29053 RepID=UPI0006C95568|nr:N-acetylneuraminate lyase-like [Copidosoma floridanum]
MTQNPIISFDYKGLVVPVFTPFNADEERSLNLKIIPEYARFLESKNIKGILVNGTTGEGTSLTVSERKEVAETWAAAVRETKQLLMIQVGGLALKDVKELSIHAEKLGADAILCLPEMYLKPRTVDEVVDYLKIVGESAPNTPLFYYDFPRATSVNIDMGRFFELVGEMVPTFFGVKTDLDRALQAKQINDNHTIFVAGDMTMIGSCAAGMESYIMTSLNFMTESAFDLLEFGKGNVDLPTAQKRQEYISRNIREITRYGSWVETMKIAMSLTTKFFMGPPRAPLKLLSKEDAESMARGLRKIGTKTDTTALIEMYSNL